MHQHRILLVEDEVELAELLADLVRDLGHEVRTADSLAGAREHLLGFRPCAVISDVTLPDVGRDELVARLRELVGDAPIILMSAITPSELRKLAEEHGAQGVLSKPFELAEFEAAIRFECPESAEERPGA